MSFDKVSGKAKVMGTMICVGGAMLLTLYKGVEVHMWPIKINLLHHANEATAHKKLVGESGTFALGIVLAVTSCICYSLWIVLLVSSLFHFSLPFSLPLINSIYHRLCLEVKLRFEVHGSRL